MQGGAVELLGGVLSLWCAGRPTGGKPFSGQGRETPPLSKYQPGRATPAAFAGALPRDLAWGQVLARGGAGGLGPEHTPN